jgi:pyruvate dehydrogenase E2 component (dihydrolipoamide acetyltransferase)
MTDDPDRQPLSRMRRAITAAMNVSAQIPQFSLERDVRLAALAAWRAEQEGSVSVSDVLNAAAARALTLHPGVNVSFDDGAMVTHRTVNVGFALALPDALDLPTLRAERQRLTAGAREGKLRGEELYGATFSISNLGPLGIDRFQALVIPPQAAILAVGGVRDEGAGPRMALTLSCDHRVLDGAPAAAFLGEIAQRLEDPAWLAELQAVTPVA